MIKKFKDFINENNPLDNVDFELTEILIKLSELTKGRVATTSAISQSFNMYEWVDVTIDGTTGFQIQYNYNESEIILTEYKKESKKFETLLSEYKVEILAKKILQMF